MMKALFAIFFVMGTVLLSTGCQSTGGGYSEGTPTFYQPTRLEQQAQIEKTHRNLYNNNVY